MSVAINPNSNSNSNSHPESESDLSSSSSSSSDWLKQVQVQGHPHLPLSSFSSLPLTSSLSSASTVPINSPPRAKPTTVYLPSLDKPSRITSKNRQDPISYFVCSQCGTHLSQTDDLISKAFSGRDGKAYLFQNTINTVLGKHEDRELLTGLHTVADLQCKMCRKSVGWTYIKAHEKSQKYKEGKFIMERVALHKENSWDDWD